MKKIIITKVRSDFKKNIDAKKLKNASSQQWIRRHINDIYVQAAKKEGYHARSAYKLIEINKKYNLLRKNNIVVDLGAAPGGWSQVASSFVGSGGKVISIDLLPIKEVSHCIPILGDFTDPEIINKTQELIKEHSSTGKANVVLSDMAPNTTGNRNVDHLRIMGLVEISFEFAKNNLGKDGSFVAKVFQGGAEQELLKEVKANFKNVYHFKPQASRKESSEMYLVATGFKNPN